MKKEIALRRIHRSTLVKVMRIPEMLGPNKNAPEVVKLNKALNFFR